MPLAKALRVGPGDVVSFVGGGGKTTAMFRLAAELSADGFRVVSTTTTHISQQQVRIAPVAITLDEIGMLGARLDEYGHCLLIGPPDGKGRVYGASRELVASLHSRSDVDVVIVEADGSRSLPFKAPGRHEPVVPDSTTILSPIAGMNCVGQPLDEDHVHRAELAAALAGQRMGSEITPQTLSRVLSHAGGGARQLPRGARLVPILNKADTDSTVRHALCAAENLLVESVVDTVAVSAMQQNPPVRECWTRVAGIVLAAGKSTRYGDTKQILPWKGTTLAAHSARVAIESGLDPVIVVVGCQSEKVKKELEGLSVHLVNNPDFESGQSSSLRKGLEALPPSAGAAVFLLADQPLITADIIQKIVSAHRQLFAPVCLPVFEGKRGNPVLFDKSLFSELLELRGDTGGREVIERHQSRIATVPSGRSILLDIDTPEDYRILNMES